MNKDYRVEWSVIINAESPLDAAKQAWGMLDDATNNQSGASILIVSDEYGNNKEWIDMEHVDLRDPIEIYGTLEHEDWLIEMERQEG